MMRSQETKVPKIVLRTLDNSSPPSEALNAITRGQAKVVLHTNQNPKTSAPSKSTSPSTISSYDIVHQLQKTPAQISIFELLEFSPLHKEILEKAFHATCVPPNLDLDKL